MSNPRTIEVIAKSEDEARAMAEKQLSAGEQIVDSEVLSAPARGIFGFVGKQEYKIKFSIDEKPEEVKEEFVEHIAPKVHNDDETSEDAEDEDASESAPSRRPRYDRENRGFRRGGRRDRRDRRDRRGGRGRNRDGFVPYEEAPESVDIPERPKEAVSEEIKNNPLYNEMFELVREVANNVGVGEIQLADFMRDGAWVIDTTGENVSQLIGKRGKTLDSLQYLLNIIFNKGKEDRTKIVLDAQGYREKRYKNLITLARRMAKKVAASGRQVELEPMSTLDRRTIHMALKDNEEVETFSKGVEPMRRVVIAALNSKKNSTSEWQPLVVDEDNENEGVDNNTETSTSVPMFMEEDA